MKKNVVSPFIEMIWEIVSDPQTDHIVSWNPNGTSFCITNSQIFADEILTTSFKHGNISSFVRQVFHLLTLAQHVQLPQEQSQRQRARILSQTVSS